MRAVRRGRIVLDSPVSFERSGRIQYHCCERCKRRASRAKPSAELRLKSSPPRLTGSPAHLTKFLSVLGDERQLQAARVGSDEEIIGSGHPSRGLSLRAHLCRVRGTLSKIRHFGVTGKGVQRRSVLPVARRNFNAVEQLRLGNYRDADLADRDFRRRRKSAS